MEQKQLKYRYPGVNYFRKEDKEVFCGRDEDARKLYTQIMLSKTVVLHGDSGTGKSSLLQAGLLPLLEENDPNYLPVLIRFDEYKKSDASGKQNGPDSLVVKTIAKVNSLGISWPESNLPYINAKENDLWYLVKKIEYNKRSILFIFDQFEEIQGYSNKEISYFIKELADLFKSEIPADIYNEMQENMAQVFEKPNLSEAERDKFNRALRFLESPLNVKILFVVREDKLGVMSILSDQFPDILKNNYLLKQLTIANARKAIEDPASRNGDYFTEKFEFENTDALLATLTEGNASLVDPLQIQIICSNIERTIAVQKRIIREKDIPPIGDIISSFYKNCWTEVKKQLTLTSTAFDKMRRYYIKELVVSEKRKLVFKDDFAVPEFSEFTEKTISVLCATGLLREISSDIGSYYQLCHDRLIKPLLDDLVQLNAKKVAEARTRKRIYRARTIGIIGLALFIAFFIYTKQQTKFAALRELALKNEAEKKKHQLDELQAKLQFDTLQKQNRLIEANLANADLRRQKDSIAAQNRTSELEKQKAAIADKAKYDLLLSEQAIAAANAKTDSVEKLNLANRAQTATRIKDSMQKILVAADISRLSQQAKTSFEQKIYAWLAYDTLPNTNSEEAFSPGVFGALANSLIDGLMTRYPYKNTLLKQAGYLGIEKTFFVRGTQYYSIPFRGIKDNKGLPLYEDSTMLRSWVDENGMLIASVHIGDKDKKTFVVRNGTSKEIIASLSLPQNEDINTVVFDTKNLTCIYSTVWYDGRSPGAVGYINAGHKNPVAIQSPAQKGEFLYLSFQNGLSGITSTGRYYEWDANYANAKHNTVLSLSDRLQHLNTVRFLMRENGNTFVGDEFGNVHLSTPENPQGRVIASESARVTAIAACSNNIWAAAAFANGTLVLWKLNSPRPIPAFLAGNNACSNNKTAGRFVSLVFSKDNKNLLAVSDNGAVFTFPLSMNVLARKICEKKAELNDPVARKRNNIPAKIKNICNAN